MSSVQSVSVTDDDTDIRLDRWFKRHFPNLTHGALEKLLRTGQIRVDGARAKSNQRVYSGQIVRVPPLGQLLSAGKKKRIYSSISEYDAAFIQGLVIYMDSELIALNKPPGLAVQGGSKTTRHVDAMLDSLRFDGHDRPGLVHR